MVVARSTAAANEPRFTRTRRSAVRMIFGPTRGAVAAGAPVSALLAAVGAPAADAIVVTGPASYAFWATPALSDDDDAVGEPGRCVVRTSATSTPAHARTASDTSAARRQLSRRLGTSNVSA